MVRGEHEVQVERAQQREHLAAIAAVHADENLVEQNNAWCFWNGLVVRSHHGEQRQMQDNGFLTAGQGTVQFPGQELPALAVRAIYFDYELVLGGVVEDLS